MRPGGHGWPHPRYTPFDTHLGRLITETGVFQVKLTDPPDVIIWLHAASDREIDGEWKEWRMTALAMSNWALAC